MLRTFFQQNEDWFTNSDHPFSKLGEMESEIAELRTISKVSRLRKQIECREEGAWMVVKDVPDDNAPSGSRKVTAYGRTRRSVVRSVTTNSDFDNTLENNVPSEPIVQLPSEEGDINSNQNSVEITEVFEEPLRTNIFDAKKESIFDNPSKKKTSVVTLGEGNIVLIDPEKESNFHVTGFSKGKVADAVNTLEKSSEKKPKKVGFCKTEVHFAPDSGKINIVETDEKPPPTQVYRRKKRPRGTRRNSNCLPKHYFGDISDLGEDSTQSNESDKDDIRPHSFPPRIESSPQIKYVFPAFEKTIKSESKDAKYRHSSPEKLDVDFSMDKVLSDEKEIFRKLKQPSFRENFLKENDLPSDETAVNYPSFNQSVKVKDTSRNDIYSKGQISSVNGLISRHNNFTKDKLNKISSNNLKENFSKEVDKPKLNYTEFFKFPGRDEVEDDSCKKIEDSRPSDDHTPLKSTDSDQPKYGYLNKPKSFLEDTEDSFTNISKVPIDQDIKSEISFLENMSPKLQNLIKNSVEHEFQLRQKQILERKTLERKFSSKDGGKIKSSINIRSSSKDRDKVEKNEYMENIKQKSTKGSADSPSKHEFQLKREQITKNVFSEPVYSRNKERKDTPYLLNEEPIPAPREKVHTKSQSSVPPKPKPRTVLSPDRPHTAKVTPRQQSTRQSDTSSLSRRARSRESLTRGKEPERTLSRNQQNKDETKSKKIVPIKIENGLQRLTKTKVQVRKVSRGEPLRSFEKVSNGWVGVVPGNKKEDGEAPKLTTTSRTSVSKALPQQSSQHSSEMSGGDMDEMTASYSEISDGGGAPTLAPSANRPSQLELLNRLDGTVTAEEGVTGKMISFVADDLEAKLRLASPRGILAALESEACALAASVDSLTESLSDTLHGISAMTVDCLETYTSVVTKTSDAIDANIKSMYQLMAKSEELSKAMAPLYRLSAHIKNIKHLLDLIEACPS